MLHVLFSNRIRSDSREGMTLNSEYVGWKLLLFGKGIQLSSSIRIKVPRDHYVVITNPDRMLGVFKELSSKFICGRRK